MTRVRNAATGALARSGSMFATRAGAAASSATARTRMAPLLLARARLGAGGVLRAAGPAATRAVLSDDAREPRGGVVPVRLHGGLRGVGIAAGDSGGNDLVFLH